MKDSLFFQISTLNGPSSPTWISEKNGNLYMKKVNSFQIYERKWYLLLPIQDILDIINWSRISDESTFTSAT